ncbi:hypothetical protein BC941DRAFT_434863 [Chlamydoabsidia padenii]|nr:hypothetical protein BC941DRAFT_434863 [Chlamydoabsidia padenii]
MHVLVCVTMCHVFSLCSYWHSGLATRPYWKWLFVFLVPWRFSNISTINNKQRIPGPFPLCPLVYFQKRWDEKINRSR